MFVYVVIPVFEEADNINGLVEEFSQLPIGHHRLVIDFIDDSHDRLTVQAIQLAALEYPSLSLRYLQRIGENRNGGLAGAVITGMWRASQAGAGHIFVMDGDGQHPPTVLLDMVQQLENNDHDVVIASRYTAGGSHEGLDGTYRRFISRAATWVAKSLFPIRLRGITDPMTGLFALRLGSIDVGELHATGFKILLEILLSSPELQVSEVPVVFRQREYGQSKAVPARGVEYLQHLSRRRLRLLASRSDRQLNLQYMSVYDRSDGQVSSH